MCQLRHGGHDPAHASRGEALRLRRAQLLKLTPRHPLALALPLSLIHPSAWKRNSPKFTVSRSRPVPLFGTPRAAHIPLLGPEEGLVVTHEGGPAFHLPASRPCATIFLCTTQGVS